MARNVPLMRVVKIGLLSLVGGLAFDIAVFELGAHLRPMGSVDSRSPARAAVTLMPEPAMAATAPVTAPGDGLDDDGIVARGNVDYDPAHYAHVASRTPGLVRRLLKGPGDEVRRGDLLALIDAGDVGKAKADLLLSLAQFELADANLTRLEGAASLLPERDLRSARGKQREARLRLFNDRQTLLNLGFTLNLGELECLSDPERVRFLGSLGLPQELRGDSETDPSTATLVPLVAPLDGVVVRRDAIEGQAINFNQARTLFVVADLKQLQLDLDVDAKEASRVEIGARVSFLADGRVVATVGTVVRIDPEIDATTQKVRVVADILNADGRLQPFAAGTARIDVTSSD